MKDRLTIRLKPEQREDLEKRASKEKRSLANYIINALKLGLKK